MSDSDLTLRARIERLAEEFDKEPELCYHRTPDGMGLCGELTATHPSKSSRVARRLRKCLEVKERE